MTFEGEFKFLNTPLDGSYYIVITHRNSIETWSAVDINVFATDTTQKSYKFTDSQSAAYGDNTVRVDTIPNKFAIYSGDVVRDGIVNLNDIISISNDASLFVTGYITTDLNGDNSANLNDILLAFNNSNNFASVMRP